MHENISDSEDCVADLSTPKNATDITYQSVIDLSGTQKKLKADSRNNKLQCLNEKTDGHETNGSAVDKVEAFNLVTKENIETGKVNNSAWCNLKWSSSLNRHASVKHKLPLMPPPERGRNKIAHANARTKCNEQKKEVSNADAQTDTVYIVTEEDYDLIQFIKSNGITKEALTSLEYYDDDINNNVENQPELEPVSIPLPEEEQTTEDKSIGEEKEVTNLIEKYSEENKAKLSNFLDCASKQVTDLSTNPVSETKDKNFFEYIHNSLWQIVICMSNYKESVEKYEKVKAFSDKSTQIDFFKNSSTKNENNFSPTAALKEVRLPKPKMTSNKAEYNMIGQKSQVIQRTSYTLHQVQPAPAPTPRPPQPRAPRQPNQPAQHKFQEPLIKRPRLNPPDTSQETVNRLNSQMQSTNFSAPRWQIGPSKQFAGEWPPRYSCNVARPQWYNQMAPLPPPPPPHYNQDHRFAGQNNLTMGQYQGSLQQQDMAEYQRYQQMEMQKKIWESQLKNYPNSAWSRPEN